ncbi:hypothetical protein JM93_02980 [Roseibium hamelinense]|uniref:Endonuclease YncB(Thermonuclease family) n=1 Tax=Roseibium hamelinense TaxID=150831 RepID=A0A562SV85_9HYPH|nr:thermonuclease family protein [Roseibium hamelinense]MTI43051.1 thermonuclease family protein [Roseibium hamelinense]TWI84646.1 hypothetical protein JM93_02980 [Roseibium hamelinense]
MSLRPLIVPVLVIVASAAVVTWLLVTDPEDVLSPVKTSNEKPAPLAPAPDQAVTASTLDTVGKNGFSDTTAPAPLPAEIRDVSPEGVSAPLVQGQLTRVAPSKAYEELKNPPIEPIPDGPLEVRRPQVLNAGLLKGEDLTIRLAFIKPLQADQTCLSRLGGNWPCGARARTSLRGLVRMFAITCEKREDLGPRKISATCKRQNIDLGEWLLKYGWAEASEDAPQHYKDLVAQAKQKKIGKWQSEWLDALDQPVADTFVPETVDLPADTADFLNQTGEQLLDGSFENPFDLPSEQEQPLDNENLPPLRGDG